MLDYVNSLIKIETYDEPKKVNNSVNLSYGRVDIDETKLDIFQPDKTPIATWQPKINLEPYENLTKWCVDIETAGLDPTIHRIFMIGIINATGKHLILDDEDETITLRKFIAILINKKPNFLFPFNGFEFDLPFIIKRCQVHKIKHPFYVSPKQTVHSVAQKFGQPSIFNSVWLSYSKDPKDRTDILDIYHQLLAYDFTARKLTAHNLKEAPLQLGLRKEPRLDLPYNEILDCWQNDRSRLKEYLIYDLQDTLLLADFLIPSVYYQKEYLPSWKVQSIATGGNGSKWNDILKNYYRYDETPTPKHNYQGALTFAESGFFRYVAKVDVKSLYPNCQLVYGIHSDKDTERYQLAVLKYTLEEKDRLEELGKNDRVAKQRRGTTKVIANSGYGALGSAIPYNDYKAAALVTAYGRAVLRFMFDFIESSGGFNCSSDTDGLFYACADDEDGSKRREIFEKLSEALPEGISIAYELTAKSIFTPLSDRKVKAVDMENCSDWSSGQGLRKNYIIVLDSGKLYLKGKFVKRNRSLFEREFQPNLVKLLTLNGEAAAAAYYQETRSAIVSGDMPTDYFSITRKASKAERAVVALGLVNDEGVCTYWEGEADPVLHKKTSEVLKTRIEKTNSKPYCIWHYTALVDEFYHEVFPK